MASLRSNPWIYICFPQVLLGVIPKYIETSKKGSFILSVQLFSIGKQNTFILVMMTLTDKSSGSGHQFPKRMK